MASLTDNILPSILKFVKMHVFEFKIKLAFYMHTVT